MNINDKCKTYGKNRLEVLQSIQSREDFDKLWEKPQNAFDFEWGDCWKAVVEYGVYDFEAEVGFYIDYLGFSLNAAWDRHAMLMTPDGAFAFTVYEDKKSKNRTNKLLNIQFMLNNIKTVSVRLKKNKVNVIQRLKKEWGPKSSVKTFKILTPNDVVITLWGFDQK